MKYRADIDGLRALAVLSVVFYHLGFGFIPGGFLGVDVFFVISGYLITTIIVEEVRNSGTFSFGGFYARRVRRLIPSLITIVLLTFVASVYVLPDDLLSDFSASIAFTFLSISNLYFWLSSGYFDTSSEFKPLLHTWSLSVEEQFYLFWPGFLLLITWLSKKRLWISPVVVLLIGLLSFGLGELFLGVGNNSEFRILEGVVSDPASAAFYLTPFRIYEFAIGAIIYWFPQSKAINSVVRNIVSILALFALVLAMAFITDEMRFPSYNALIVSVATAALLYAQKDTIAGTVMSLAPVVFIGKISYTLYLVHWPVIVLYTVWKQSPPSLIEISALLVLMLVVSSAIYFLIENPLRRPKTDSKISRSGFALACAGIMLVALVPATWTLRQSGSSEVNLAQLDDGQGETMEVDVPLKAEAVVTEEGEFAYPLDPSAINTAAAKEAVPFRCLWEAEPRDYDSADGSVVCNPDADLQALTIGNSHEGHGYRLIRNLLNAEYQDGEINLLFASSHSREPKKSCSFHKNGGLPFRTTEPTCEWVGEQLNDIENLASTYDVIVVSALRPLDWGQVYLDEALKIQQANPDVRVVVVGSVVSIEPYRCIDIANKSKNPRDCVKSNIVDYYEPNEENMLRERWPELDFFYVDQRALLCGDAKVEECTITYKGAPIFFDSHHFSMAAIPVMLQKAENTALQSNLRTYLFGQ